MSKQRLSFLAAAVGLALAASVVPAGAAAAEDVTSRVILKDPSGDVWAIGDGEHDGWAPAGDVPTADVVRAVVRHGRANVVVTMTFANLRRVEAQSYSAMVVTPEQYGAAFVMAGPGRWRGRHMLVDGEFGRVRCRGLRHSIDYRADRVEIAIPRRCIGRPAWVKVGMSNMIFRGETEGEFLEITDHPHSNGPEHSLTKRIYRRS